MSSYSLDIIPRTIFPRHTPEHYSSNIFLQHILPTLFSEHGDLADVGGGFSLAAGGSDYGQDG